MAEHVQTVLASGRAGAFSVSDTGLLAYREGSGVRGTALTWFDRSGKPGTTVGDVAPREIQFSPDRKSVAGVIAQQPNLDIWIYDVARGLRTRFTFDPAPDGDAIWSPDGRTIIFRLDRKGRGDLYRKAVDSVGAEELLFADDSNKAPTSWSADGKVVLYTAVAPNSKTGADLWALPLSPERPGAVLKPFPVLQTPFIEVDAKFSPDGRWIAYSSNESQQRFEVYVTPFPLPPSGPAGKRQISTSGVSRAGPRWRDDGKEIFYVSADRRLMSAEVTIKGGSLEVGAVRPLFTLSDVVNPEFDVSADGQRFLLLSTPEEKSAQPLTLIQNWVAGLRRP